MKQIYLSDYEKLIYPILKQLCKIPAPSHHEDERAKFCKKYFEDIGYDNVYIDEAKNVICEINCSDSDNITVFAAHTDTVFSDTEPMPFYEKDGIAYCPGIGDDTASVAVLLVAAKYIRDNNIIPKDGFLFVCNSCEEGLGNLKGVRKLMDTYKDRIYNFISFDNRLNSIYTECVGSHRYSVEVRTEGGHSFSKFGNENAIFRLSEIITEIYKIKVPVFGNSKTTYNVGIIEGGTSINTIAQNAKMLCEYRSDNAECIDIMQEKFKEIFKNAEKQDIKVIVEKVGDRPCGRNVDNAKLEQLINNCKNTIENAIGEKVILSSASTDCNIPMSLGIPSVSVGVYNGAKAHTRQEWLEISSLNTGLKVAIDLMNLYL